MAALSASTLALSSSCSAQALPPLRLALASVTPSTFRSAEPILASQAAQVMPSTKNVVRLLPIAFTSIRLFLFCGKPYSATVNGV